MIFAGPLERYSRAKTLFRIILAIPIVILRYVMGLLLEIGAVAAWFIVLVTGKMPRGLFDLMVLANSYTARSDAYLYLLTETYPPFQDEQTRSAGLSEPSISRVFLVLMTSWPASLGSTATSTTRSRTRAPALTGARKRTLSRP